MQPYQPYRYLEDEISELSNMLKNYTFDKNPGMVTNIILQMAEKRKLLTECRKHMVIHGDQRQVMWCPRCELPTKEYSRDFVHDCGTNIEPLIGDPDTDKEGDKSH